MKPLEQCSSVDEILQFLRGSKSPNYPISPEKLEPALTRAAALGAERMREEAARAIESTPTTNFFREYRLGIAEQVRELDASGGGQ